MILRANRIDNQISYLLRNTLLDVIISKPQASAPNHSTLTLKVGNP